MKALRSEELIVAPMRPCFDIAHTYATRHVACKLSHRLRRGIAININREARSRHYLYPTTVEKDTKAFHAVLLPPSSIWVDDVFPPAMSLSIVTAIPARIP